MGHVRIVCRLPEQPEPSKGHIRVNTRIADISDCSVTFITSEGKEEPIIASAVSFHVGPNEEARATIELMNVELDVIAEAFSENELELRKANAALIDSGRAIDAALMSAGFAQGRTQLQAVLALISERDRLLSVARVDSGAACAEAAR